MAMTGFVNAFKKIDTDDDGVINEQDLQNYAEKSGLTPAFVRKWKTLFDAENTGQIHYDHFCNVLGMVGENDDDSATDSSREQQANKPLNPTTHSVPPVVLSSEQPTAMEENTLELVERAWQTKAVGGPSQSPASWQHTLLLGMDDAYGQHWRIKETTACDLPKISGALAKTRIVFSPDGGLNKYVLWKEKARKGGCFCCF